MKIFRAMFGVYLIILTQSVGLSQEEAVESSLRQKLQQRYSDVLEQAQIDRHNDSNLHNMRLEALDKYLQNTPGYHSGSIGSGISKAIGYGGGRIPPQDILRQPDAVPFLLDILINGPPPQTKGTWKAPDSKRLDYSYDWQPGEYELRARCLAAAISGRYKHSDVLPILVEHLKGASQLELKKYSAVGLFLSQDPNAIAPLMDALSDPHKEIRKCAWEYINRMTGRGFTMGEVPSSQQIAEFKNWWQKNRDDVIKKFYNAKTGRLEPKFEDKRRGGPIAHPPAGKDVVAREIDEIIVPNKGS